MGTPLFFPFLCPSPQSARIHPADPSLFFFSLHRCVRIGEEWRRWGIFPPFPLFPPSYGGRAPFCGRRDSFISPSFFPMSSTMKESKARRSNAGFFPPVLVFRLLLRIFRRAAGASGFLPPLSFFFPFEKMMGKKAFKSALSLSFSFFPRP